ncbi:H-NS family nucleoid-associated regulatory protein [Rosenbergiella nectarea]|uniref:H-NS family histone-like protein n=1 Tax=Rosenbergiella nectarea TaxID=988801 RepID=UPI001F4E3498|nr:H-NS family nucleoid-associated regulatory protein [Rosenbergiella nectarea]
MKLSSMKNVRLLRAQARNVEIKVLEEILAKIRILVHEKKEIKNNYFAQQREKVEQFEKYMEILSRQGFSNGNSKTASKCVYKTKRKPRPVKYSYTDKDGIVRYWTGQGRTPSIIMKGLENGKKLEDFLVQRDIFNSG